VLGLLLWKGDRMERKYN